MKAKRPLEGAAFFIPRRGLPFAPHPLETLL
jgi:hypothetical protein